MTTYFTATIDMPAVAREIVSDHAYDELFNELANQFNTREEVLATLEKHCGAELDDNGKLFLLAVADFVDRQFPGERKPTDDKPGTRFASASKFGEVVNDLKKPRK